MVNVCESLNEMQDDLLAELEEFELESDLLEVGEPSKAPDLGDPIDELPEVRKYSMIRRAYIIYYNAVTCRISLVNTTFRHDLSLSLSLSLNR